MGGTRRRDLDRQAKVPEDPGDHGRLLDARDQGRRPPPRGHASTASPQVRAMSDAQH
ncbi:MAG: hypothetical protein M3P18_09630 [Actinomycetota bacterium]|nr:hypothetical protein [Actinomycetota bacterium]